MSFPIDIVLPWVDGDDRQHIKRRKYFSTDHKETSREDVGGDSRYQSLGEIRYCVESINLFAPFVRKIFIVTDGQDPDLEGFLSERFPDGHIPIEIVDHKVIFKGYEMYLPVFNSRAIESMIWRIPDLSEHFILMNDDFILTGKVTPEDFFKDGKTVCYCHERPILWALIQRLFRPKKNGYKRISFKESMLNAASIMGRRHTYFYLSHTPRALKRSFYEDFFSKREDVMRRNISYRFRNADQYNSQELFYISEDRAGRCLTVSPDDRLMYLMPKKRKGYVERKLKRMERKKNAVFCCINTLSLARPEEQTKVLDWIAGRLDQKRLKSE